MQIRHGDKSNVLTLGDAVGGEVVLFQDTIWIVTQQVDSNGVMLVDVSDGWGESFKEDTLVYKLSAVLDLSDVETSTDEVELDDFDDHVTQYPTYEAKPQPVESSPINVELSASKKKKKKKNKNKSSLYNTI